MKILRRVSLLLIAFLLLAGSIAAQKRRGTPPKTPAQAPAPRPGPAFENVLAVDTYRVHVEIRGVGQLLKTPSFNDVIEPVMKVAGPPKEFKTLITWLNSQADALITSRMMVASWAVRPNVPNVLLAIEFASPEEAQKFEPRLRNFLPKLLPTPTPSPSPGPETAPSTNSPTEKKPATAPEPGENREAQVKEAGPSFVIKQAGSLVYVSDVAFTFKNLRPAGSKLLTEDPNFRRVNDRFATESVLVFVDTAGMQREDEERRRKLEEENLKLAQAQANKPAPNEGNEQEAKPLEDPPDEVPAPPELSNPDVIALAEMNERQSQVELVNENPQPPPPSPNIAGELIGRMANLFFSGPTTLPDAVGLALAFEPESYALRLLLVNEPSVKGNPIPFMPQLISGPPLTLEAAGVFPADTEFFVSLSLDYKQILDGMVKALEEQPERVGMTPAGEGEAESPFAVYERKAGIKLNEDLIPLLGNEVAVMLPLQTLDVGPGKVVTESTAGETEGASGKGAAPPMPNPVLALAVRDRDGLRAVMPKVIESFGFKGASLLAQTEKRGDTEIVSYGGALSYAFVGNFLLLSTSSKEISRVVDSYLNHDTLSSQSLFRNSTRWQPQQVLGQFYLSPKLMESYRDFARGMDSLLTDQLGDLLSRLSPTSEPLTYALSNEGLGPMHELRLPKNLALLMVTSMFGGNRAASASTNESLAEGRLRAIFSAESTFRATNKDEKFGSIDQLIAANLLVKEFFEPSGYRLEVNALGSRFEATAVPVEYGKTGKLSFFIDESGVLRAGDHGGGPATVADKPVQ